MNQIDALAELCHEANRGLCEAFGDHSQVPWADAPEWQRESARNGIRAIRDGEITTPEGSHDSWVREKLVNGWTYGPVKDPERKTHPCLVEFGKLPPQQQAKDHVFFAIVRTYYRMPGTVEAR